MIDLAQIGHSLQGAAQLLGTAGSIVYSGEYAKRSAAMPVRIYAGIPRHGCWEIPALIITVAPVVLHQFPVFVEVQKVAATKAATMIVNYVITRWKGEPEKPSEMAIALETIQKMAADVGQTSRHLVDAVVRMAEQQRPAVRLLVIPVGLSCEIMRVGETANGAVTIDRTMRAAIDAPEESEIQPTRKHEILISEMDWINATCKFSFREDEESDHRVTGEITDPTIQTPNNPYSVAFSEQRWITVVGKLQMKAGEADKLFISDIVQP
jgi:hypothetical protein